jgi:hypothetical protein
MRAGGFHGGGYRGGGMHAGRIHGGGGRHYAGGPRPSHPIAGRPGRPGRPGYPVAGRPGRPIAGYPGGGYYPRYGYRGAAYGAAVGAAAVGAYGYYNNYNGCYQDTYGNWVCPNQYPYCGSALLTSPAKSVSSAVKNRTALAVRPDHFVSIAQ